MTLLLTHESSFSLSLSPLKSGPLPSSLTTTPIALPSRFPKTSTPAVIASPSGAIFVHAKTGHVVWEYDSKGRRISEISLPGDTVRHIVPLGKKWRGTGTGIGIGSGKETVMIGLKGQRNLKVMEKNEGKWSCISELSAPKGKLSALVTNQGSTISAAGSYDGDLLVYTREGTGRVVPVEDRLRGPISHLAFSPLQPNILIVCSSANLLRITVPSDIAVPFVMDPITPFPSGSETKILDIAFPPAIKSEGVKESRLYAVLNEAGQVALLDYDDNEAPATMVSFGRADLAGLVFLDGATLAARTRHGSLLVKDLRCLADPPKEVACSAPIISAQLLTMPTRAPRPSTIAPSSSSSRRSALGENENTTNIPTPPPVPRLNIGSKAIIRSDENEKVARPSPSLTERDTASATSRAAKLTTEEDKVKKRIVSAPVPSIATAIKAPTLSAGSGSTQAPRQPRVSSSRSISGPSATATTIMPSTTAFHVEPQPSSIASSSKHRVHIAPPVSHVSRSTTPITIMEEIEEDQQLPLPSTDMHTSHDILHRPKGFDLNEEERRDRSVQLDWALDPTPSRVDTVEAESEKSDRERMEEMWREIANLRLDMLRMKREHKHDLNQAVRYLRDEMRADKVLIENQRREIDRLRRGY
ncbi:hypothetical protein IAU59_001964 [Kwoniella sp. CBS 9459]